MPGPFTQQNHNPLPYINPSSACSCVMCLSLFTKDSWVLSLLTGLCCCWAVCPIYKTTLEFSLTDSVYLIGWKDPSWLWNASLTLRCMSQSWDPRSGPGKIKTTLLVDCTQGPTEIWLPLLTQPRRMTHAYTCRFLERLSHWTPGELLWSVKCLARGHNGRQWHLGFDTSNPLVASSLHIRPSDYSWLWRSKRLHSVMAVDSWDDAEQHCMHGCHCCACCWDLPVCLSEHKDTGTARPGQSTRTQCMRPGQRTAWVSVPNDQTLSRGITTHSLISQYRFKSSRRLQLLIPKILTGIAQKLLKCNHAALKNLKMHGYILKINAAYSELLSLIFLLALFSPRLLLCLCETHHHVVCHPNHLILTVTTLPPQPFHYTSRPCSFSTSHTCKITWTLWGNC